MLSVEVRKILNDPERIAKRDAWFAAMRAVHAGEDSANMIIAGLGGAIPRTEALYTEPEKWMDEALAELARLAADSVSDAVFHPLAVWPAVYGVHFVDKLLLAAPQTAGCFFYEIYKKFAEKVLIKL